MIASQWPIRSLNEMNLQGIMIVVYCIFVVMNATTMISYRHLFDSENDDNTSFFGFMQTEALNFY